MIRSVIEVKTGSLFIDMHLGQTVPFIMKKNLVILFVFAVGMMCGVALNQWSANGQFAGGQSGRENSEERKDVSSMPVDRILLDHFLPDTAPYWLYCDFDAWRKHKKNVREFFEKPTISTVWGELCASIPKGVTPALSELFDASSQMRFFVLPPREENPLPVYIAAFTIDKATEPGAAPPGIASLLNDFPESASEEIEIDKTILRSFETELGQFACIENDGLLWIGNNKAALEQFWRQPPPPPENPDAVRLFDKMLAERTDALAACFMNVDTPGEPIPGLLGTLTANLRPAGVKKAALFFEWMKDGGRMTVLAPCETPVPWAAGWLPMQKYPFGGDDPAGLLEAAFRWPGEGIPLSATAALVDASGELVQAPIVTADGDPNEKTLRDERTNSKKLAQKEKKEDKENSRSKEEKTIQDAPPSDAEPVNRSFAGFIAQAQFRFLSRMFPAGGVVGLNVFGFFDGAPTLALAIPSMDSEEAPMKMLAALPQVSSSTLEVALLPATCFQLGENSEAQSSGLDELLLIERDAVTYLFDAPEAAKNYMQNQNQSERSKDIRSTLDKVKSPAQIEFVLSRDFFRFILDQEKTLAPSDFEHRDKLNSFLDELFESTRPMAISAGLDGQQWFMETYSEDQIAHWVDTGLLVWAMRRLSGH